MPERLSKLPRRDLLLIPLLVVLTCLVLLSLAEVSARIVWQSSEDDVCVRTDATLGHRFTPNCVSRIKAMEGPWVTNRYNACGYRTDQDCGPRQAGVRRIDLMGSSTAQGFLIPYEGTVAANLGKTLSAYCNADVQLENMGMIGYQGEIIFRQLDEALALKPDAIVFLVTPFDFDPPAADPPAGSGTAPPTQQAELLRRLRNISAASRALAVAQHLAFTDNDRFSSLYLGYGDRADFLRPPFTPAWRKRLSYLDDLLGRMQTKASAAEVTLVLAYVPSRVQTIYLSRKTRPAGIDPFAFGHAIGEIAKAHDVSYIDVSDLFTHIENAGSLFYPQDGHLTAEGQPLVGHAIAAEVLSAVPSFQGCARPNRAASTQGAMP